MRSFLLEGNPWDLVVRELVAELQLAALLKEELKVELRSNVYSVERVEWHQVLVEVFNHQSYLQISSYSVPSDKNI